MFGKRIFAFLGVLVIMFGVIAWTSPALLKGTKLGLDLKGGFEVLYRAAPFEGSSVHLTSESLKQTAKSLEQRVDKSGLIEPEITTEGADRIRVRMPGLEDNKQKEVIELLTKPIRLTFRAPDGTIELDGTDFKQNGASVIFNELNQPIVSIQLLDAKKFEDVTRRLLGTYLAIYLDEEELSRPGIHTVIASDSAIIEGRYTIEEARELRDMINMGALPLSLEVIYENSVGAKLGMNSLQDTVKAGVIGSLVVFVFMIIIFRIPGVVASISIITYAWLLVLVQNLMGATLTLPGIAAFILGVGMAVDANIITAERIKEEIRSGKSMLSSLKAGSKHSFRTIMDANITSIIAAIVLYYIGDGAIKGFALTMIFSIIVSVITNIYFSRFLLGLLVRSNKFMKPGYFGVKEAEIREL